jgi:DNA-directed RNA polymerase subunit RPC12/RpoP
MTHAAYRCDGCGDEFRLAVASAPGPGVATCPGCGRMTARRARTGLAVPVGGCVTSPACAAGLDLDRPMSPADPLVRD